MIIQNDVVLKIMSLPSVGRKTAFKLLNSLTSNISSDNELVEFLKNNAGQIRNTLTLSDFTKAFDKANETIEKSLKAGIRIVNFYDAQFPTLLKTLDDAPLLVNAKGNYSDINCKPSVAVIGTRDPSDHGLKVGIRLGEVFGEAGFNVVSGLAIGCDTAGHKGCLNKFGYTTAVLAHGLDSLYPKENKYLADKILDESGLLISEYTIGQRAQANFFVERDRIQAGLSQAVIVVETDIKGGTMHTVKFADNNKRIVAAFNHDSKYLWHPKTQGNQYLIKNGTAKPLATPESIEDLKTTLLDVFNLLNPNINANPAFMPQGSFVNDVVIKPIKSKPDILVEKKPKTSKEKVAAKNAVTVGNDEKIVSKKTGEAKDGAIKDSSTKISKEGAVKSKSTKVVKQQKSGKRSNPAQTVMF